MIPMPDSSKLIHNEAAVQRGYDNRDSSIFGIEALSITILHRAPWPWAVGFQKGRSQPGRVEWDNQRRLR